MTFADVECGHCGTEVEVNADTESGTVEVFAAKPVGSSLPAASFRALAPRSFIYDGTGTLRLWQCPECGQNLVTAIDGEAYARLTE